MTRWAITLSALDYRIQHRPGAQIGHADFLSRFPLPDCGKDLYAEPAGVFLLEAKTPDILTADSIAAETCKDPLLKDVMQWVTHGWPPSIPAPAQPYAQKKVSLSVLNGCLLCADRVVIPPSLRPQVLDLIHAATHPGITCSKAIGKSIVWWPGWCSDVEKTVRLCTECQLAAPMPARRPYSPWPAPQRPWQRVHLDYAGPFMGHMFLVVIDAFSKWPVIKGNA
jgi:hypothetical protein